MTLPEISALPATEQFSSYLHFIFIDGFNMGSYRNYIPLALNNLPFTIFFLGASIVVAIIFSILFGAIAAYKFGSKIDTFLTVGALSLFLVPSWLLGLTFAKYLGPYFPVAHWYSLSQWAYVSPWSHPLGFMQDFLWHMVLPVTTLAFSIAGVYFLVVRSSMMNFMHERFVTTARAIGLKPRKIIFKHILRNAIIPITAIAALTPIIVVNAAVIVENLFSLTGVGYYTYRSMITVWGFERDVAIPSVQALFLALAFITVCIQFVFDVAHHYLDPRLRTDGGGLKFLKRPKELRLKLIWARFKKKKSGIFGLAILSLFIFVALAAPVLPLTDPDEPITFGEAVPPSLANPFGTDEFGRDVLSRLIWGSRVSLAEFVAALSIALLIGGTVGLLSGYYDGRWFSYVLDRITDVFVSIPLLVFVVYFPMAPNFFKWILAVGAATWGITAKIVRSQVITVKERAYIEAAKAAGARDRYILLHYIIPDAFPVIASSVIYTGALIIGLQSMLDFFGFRRYTWSTTDVVLSPSVITWGSIISFGSTVFFVSDAWWIVLPPALCMFLLGLSIVLVSDTIAYALNPEL